MVTKIRKKAQHKWNRYHADKRKQLSKEWYEKNKDKVLEKMQEASCKKMGITLDYYNSLPKICSNPGCGADGSGGKNWHKDHDHKTGKFRGILCNGCNAALGFLKEDRNRIRGLIDYLDKHV